MSRPETTRVAAQTGQVPARPTRSIGRVLRVILVVAVVAAGTLAVASQWADVKDSIRQLGAASLVISFLAILGGQVMSMLAWRAILADLGSPLPVTIAARVFFVGQLGKYMPGAVWAMVAQMELARDQGVPRRRAAATYALTMVIVLVAGLFAAASALPLLADDTAARYRWFVLLAPLILIMLHPRIANPLMSRAFRLLRRESLERPLTLRGVGIAFGFAVCTWVLLGLHLAVLVANFDVGMGRALLISTGAFALAWCAGIAVMVVPAGAGTREVALVAALAVVLDRGQAIVVALCSRLLMTLGDLVSAGIAAGVVFHAQRRRRRAG